MTATLLKHACTHMHLCLCSQQQRHGLIQQSLKNLFSVVWCHLKVQSAVSVCLGVFRMDGNVLMKPPNLPVVDRIVTPGLLGCVRHHKLEMAVGLSFLGRPCLQAFIVLGFVVPFSLLCLLCFHAPPHGSPVISTPHHSSARVCVIVCDCVCV